MQSKIYKSIFIIGLIGALLWYVNYQNQSTALPTKDLAAKTENPERDGEERENPQARMDYEFKMLKDPATGKIPRGIHQQSIKAAQRTDEFQLKPQADERDIPSITITLKGPNNYGGRTRAFAFDIRNSDIAIAGGVSGGIFRSTNNGNNWSKVTPAGMLHNMTAIAQDTRAGHQDTWYVGTGERLGNSAYEGDATYLGFGIWKSTDNGLTWNALASTQGGTQQNLDNDFDYISKILVNPDNGDVMVMAGEVLKRSTDGGTNWIDELGDSGTNQGRPGDIIYNAVSSTFYAAIHGQIIIDPSPVTNPGIWASSDGDNWTQIRTPSDLNADGVGRIILSNAGNTAGIVTMYHLFTPHNCSGGSGGTSEAGLQHFDGASTWTNHTNNISDCASGSTSPKGISLQGAYNMCLTTKPDDADLVYLGGVEIFRYNLSTNAYDFIGGSQLAASAINLHVDNHILVFEDNTTLWAGNDGGLRNTSVTGTLNSDGFIWSSKNTDYITYQYYDADIHPASGSSFLAGAAQDNAFTIQPATAEALEVGPTADGTAVGIIDGSSFNLFSIIAAFQNGGLARVTDSSEENIQPVGKEQGFNTKIHLDDDNREYLYFPDDSPGLLRTRVASSVGTAITGNANTGWEDLSGINPGSQISALASSRDVQYGAAYTASDANRKLYFGTENGAVFRLNDPAFGSASNAATNITPSGSSGFVSDIAVNPMNDKEVMVTYSNYGVVSVWHTSDASVASPTWNNIEGTGVVEISSARSAAIVNSAGSTVYLVGTSAGLYATDDLNITNFAGGAVAPTWQMVGTNSTIGMAIVSEMRHRTSDNKMALGTHGNGMFLLEFPSALPVELTAFTGKALDRNNLLTWETAMEENNEGFEIQQSLNGKDFVKIGFVAGNGNTNQQQSYEFLDENVTNNIKYYRLKQLDFDGTFKYSAVISIVREIRDEVAVNIYPNPVVNTLTIENGEGTATIYTIAGQKIMTVEIVNNKEQIDVSTLAKGNYVLALQSADGTLLTHQFVK